MCKGREITLKGQVVCEYLEKFPNVMTLTLARIIYRDNISLYKDVEDVRNCIRYYRGALGISNKKKLKNKKYVRKFVQHSVEP